MQELVHEESPAFNERARRLSSFVVSWLPLFAVVTSSCLYAAHFVFGGGVTHRILDSWIYLQMASGKPVGVPFDTRILAPSAAALLMSITGLSASASFDLLTPISLLGSLLLLGQMIRKRGGSALWRGALLLAFGSSLAVTFGYTPVLADPTLLLVVCLTIAALDAGHLWGALVLACAAALTKEYGLVLGVLWAFHAYRKGFRKAAFLGLLIPSSALLLALLTRQPDPSAGFSGWTAFTSHYVFEYQLSVFHVRGPLDYAKLVYMWSWCAVWPVIVISTFSIGVRLIKRASLTPDHLDFGLLLAALPVLMLGDWTRALIIVVPFASLVATASPLAKDARFAVLVAIGGFSTALARPFHAESGFAPAVALIATILSVLCSMLIAARLGMLPFLRSKFDPQADPQAGERSAEIAFP